jgi:alkanesulfonate monooxygenase SsuD/methylene tetrahydromethanopterin reductase-like flavin-dependent oxidoreductase (luciferase family)
MAQAGGERPECGHLAVLEQWLTRRRQFHHGHDGRAGRRQVGLRGAQQPPHALAPGQCRVRGARGGDEAPTPPVRRAHLLQRLVDTGEMAWVAVGVARSLNVVMNAAEYEKAIENRMVGRRRVERLSQRPDAQNQKKVMSEDAVREVAEAGTLYGTPDDIAVKLQALRDVGAEYVLINSAGGPASLRRFAREVMPAFLG